MITVLLIRIKAVPDNYLEVMPRSIAAVRKNLRIVMSILNPEDEEATKLQVNILRAMKSLN